MRSGSSRAFHFMMLHQVYIIDLQSFQRLVDLLLGRLERATIDLAHQKNFFAVAVLECHAHANLAAPIVIIPAVIHEIDSAIDGTTDYLDTFLLVFWSSNMVAA